MIPFQKPFALDEATANIQRVLESGHTEGDGPMTQRCSRWLADTYGREPFFMMTSCTHALETAMHLLDLAPGDEVILPSFAHPSDANAVLLAGGTVVYAEVEPHHLTLDPERLVRHITSRTRAIVPIHYGGISCRMDAIMAVADQYGLVVVEDCAQSFLTRYKGRLTGTWGQMACFSFHGIKDVVAGEGGALLVNEPAWVSRASRFRQKGTNRDAFTSGLINRYEWTGPGSSYSPAELSMALLASQLSHSDQILQGRRRLFDRYARHFDGVARGENPLLAGASFEEEDDRANGHLFYLLMRDGGQASQLVQALSQAGVDARTHFVPLHESAYGRRFIRPANTFTVEADLGRRLVRLPVYMALTDSEQDRVLETVDAALKALAGP